MPEMNRPEVNRNEQRSARVENHNDVRAFNNAPAATEHRDVREDRHDGESRLSRGSQRSRSRMDLRLFAAVTITAPLTLTMIVSTPAVG